MKLSIKDVNSKNLKTIINNPTLFKGFINENKNFVMKIITKCAGNNYKEYYDDLYGIGMASLWKATKHFSSTKKGASSFSTFAWTVIRNDINQELRRIRNIKYHEISMENFKRGDKNSGQLISEYDETLWKKKNKMKDFCGEICDQLTREYYIKKLPEDSRKIVELKQENHSLHNISKMLNKNYYTVKKNYYRAMRWINAQTS